MISNLFITLLLAFTNMTYIQEENEHVKFRKEGDEAFKNRDYGKALEAYESALAALPQGENLDAEMIFNTANCARRINNNEKALKYFIQSKELNHKADMSVYYAASALKELGKEEEMEQMLLKAVDGFKTSNILGHMKKMLVTYYLEKCTEPYNQASQMLSSASNATSSQYDEIIKRVNEAFAKAKPWFEKVLIYDANNESALASLKEIDSHLEK